MEGVPEPVTLMVFDVVLVTLAVTEGVFDDVVDLEAVLEGVPEPVALMVFDAVLVTLAVTEGVFDDVVD